MQVGVVNNLNFGAKHPFPSGRVEGMKATVAFVKSTLKIPENPRPILGLPANASKELVEKTIEENIRANLGIPSEVQ